MSQTQRVLNGQEWTAPKKQVRQEPVIVPRRITKGEKMLWVIGALIIFGLSLAVVASQARLFSAARDVSILQNKFENQQKITQQLKSESDSLGSPERIVKFAETELGLKLNVDNIKVLP
ncbi:cell division protein FtsL [Sporolactobacillus spathodeae]|uniref:Cell division protein FtsL n=1 Tax=Sporolactobacillus spathodeae TaxID=1465502 RepID=A0ABS2QAD0_9BACL|nr:cell division protein FtsL [Sporolactobacillus spathodeae]MBM7658295.1 cell division protein FtsL [Sporolactobacillus spathodeae]